MLALLKNMLYLYAIKVDFFNLNINFLMKKTFTLLLFSFNFFYLNAGNIPGNLFVTNITSGQTLSIDQLTQKGNSSVLLISIYQSDCQSYKTDAGGLYKFTTENPSLTYWSIVGSSFTDPDLPSTNIPNIVRCYDPKLTNKDISSPWNKFIIDKNMATYLVIRLSDKEVIYKGTEKEIALKHVQQTIKNSELLTSLREELLKNRFTAYPNPTDGYLNFMLADKTDKQIYVEVYNVLGGKVKTVYAPVGEKEFQVDLGELESGLYVIKFIEGSYRRSIKVTLRH